MQDVLHAHELAHLALHEPAHGDAGPLGDDLGDVLLVDLFLQHLLVGLELVEALGLLHDLVVEVAHGAVAQCRRLLEVALTLGHLGLGARVLQLLLERADLADGVLLVLPVRDHRVAVLGQGRQLLVERGEPVLRRLVGLLGQRGLLDLELADPALDDVDLERHRVDLDAQTRRGLVDQVDGLVGELPGRDVPVRQHRGCDEGGVLDADAVVHLVALLEPAQDGDGVLHRRLAHVDLLEAPLERRVLLDVLAELVERGRADHAQLAARQHRLDHVAGVDRALGATRTDDRVQLVDERDDLAVAVDDLLEDGLHAVFELTAVLGARDHRRDVERDEPLVPQALGHVALDDAPGQTFGDGRLAHAGLADEDRVVLGAARQHLDDAPDLLVAPDDGVELALAGVLGEVAPVLLEGLVLLLGVLAGHAVAAAHLLERAEHGLVAHADAAEEVADPTSDLAHGEEQVLGGEVVVAQGGPLGVSGFEGGVRARGQLRLLGGLAVDLGDARQRVVDPVAQGPARDADALEDGEHHALGLREQARQQVLGRDLRVVQLARERLGGAQGLTGLAGELVGIERHASTSEPLNRTPKLTMPLSSFLPGPRRGGRSERSERAWRGALSR